MAFMLTEEHEVFYGGAAGGGKSDALLMAALMFAELPGYAAIIFRRTYPELSLPGGLLERSQNWLGGTEANWNSTTKTWSFPNGATLSFGHMELEKDKYNYKSSEFNFCAFDELTSFTETQYLYLFSRLRRQVDSFIPLRMRSASNPGDIGHAWVKNRFVQPIPPPRADHRKWLHWQNEQKNIKFIPAKLQDNPSITEEEYTEFLNKLDPFTRDQLLKGLWIDIKGNHFSPGSWPIYTDMGDAWSLPGKPYRTILKYAELTIIVAFDVATGEKDTSDFTAIIVSGLTPDGRLLILDVTNDHIRKEDLAARLDEVCEMWHPDIVCSENDQVSQVFTVEFRRWRNIPEIRLFPIGSQKKIVRATQAQIMGENKRIFLPENAVWLMAFKDQLTAFTGIQKEHDDMVDALGVIARQARLLKSDSLERDQGPMVLCEGRAAW